MATVFGYTPTAIFIGNQPRLDTTIGVNTNNAITENAAALVGLTFDQTTMDLTQLSIQDNDDPNLPPNSFGINNDYIISYNDNSAYGNSTVTANGYTGMIDSSATYNVTITYDTGTGPQTKTAVLIAWQLDNGDTYLLNGVEEGAQPTALDNLGIITNITINSVLIGFSDNLAITYFTTVGSDILCFTSGTLIKARHGEIAIEDLSVGDEVLTADHGYQPIRWIGARTLDFIELRMNPHLRPIRIRAGALGNGLPERDLLVSPQHRMLVASRIARHMFGTHEVLAAAKQLLLIDGIEVAEDIHEVTYWHFLCNEHEIVWANGALSETLYTGKQALRSVGPEARKEIFAIFPELKRNGADNQPNGARPLITGRKARKLALRHVQKNRPLLSNHRLLSVTQM
jgi:hypothetical protein